jgi:hypothetical protein
MANMARINVTLSDTEFANGVIAALSGVVTPLQGTEVGHWRPKAKLGHPLGKITGDGALLFSTPRHQAESLLIIEREGSAPGNERSILKWHRAVRTGTPITLERKGSVIKATPARILLLLCFARVIPEGWSESDFLKTAEFCKELAELIVRDPLVHSPPLEVRVEVRSYAVQDWTACGQDVANSCGHWLTVE